MSNIRLKGLQGYARLSPELTAAVRDRDNDDVRWLDDHSQNFGPFSVEYPSWRPA
jgi:hypothetical protein